jgi:hypothetical protein
MQTCSVQKLLHWWLLNITFLQTPRKDIIGQGTSMTKKLRSHVLFNLSAAACPEMASHPNENEVTSHPAESPTPLGQSQLQHVQILATVASAKGKDQCTTAFERAKKKFTCRELHHSFVLA